MSFCQRAVIEFLIKEEILAAEIHQRLQRAYESVCMGASSVRRWVGTQASKMSLGALALKQPRNECNKERVDEIIRDDRRVTVDTVA